MSDHPCPKCGSTARYRPQGTRKIGRCKVCQQASNRRRKPGPSPYPCTSSGCKNRARAKTKPGPCQSCYSRRFTGAAPKWPVDPLLDYMEKRGQDWRGRGKPERGTNITLERMDEICIDWLGVHPWVVYGQTYFQEVPS